MLTNAINTAIQDAIQTAVERTEVLDTAGNPITPGRYELLVDGVSLREVEIIEDEICLDLVAIVDQLPYEAARYRLYELRPDAELRRISGDAPRDTDGLEL